MTNLMSHFASRVENLFDTIDNLVYASFLLLVALLSSLFAGIVSFALMGLSPWPWDLVASCLIIIGARNFWMEWVGYLDIRPSSIPDWIIYLSVPISLIIIYTLLFFGLLIPNQLTEGSTREWGRTPIIMVAHLIVIGLSVLNVRRR